jgi:hypothetical protein
MRAHSAGLAEAMIRATSAANLTNFVVSISFNLSL